MTSRLCAAIRLEGIDALLLLVFAPLGLVERARLLTVSKRWQRLLLTELRAGETAPQHLLPLIVRAGSALRALDVSSTRYLFIDELLRALSGPAGSELRELVAFVPRGDVGEQPKHRTCFILNPDMAERLRAACPRLDDSSRLYLIAPGAVAALAMLSDLPGRHFLQLMPPRIPLPSWSPEESSALHAVARHQRVAAMTLFVSSYFRFAASDPRYVWAAAAEDALIDAFGTGECFVEHLDVKTSHGLADGEQGPSPLTSAAVAAAVAAAAASAAATAAAAAQLQPQAGGVGVGGGGGGCRPQRGLLSFSTMEVARPSLLAGILARSRGSLRALRLGALFPPLQPPALAAILSLFAATGDEDESPPLRSLSVHVAHLDAAAAAAFAQLLSSPTSRLHTLQLLGDAGAAPEDMPTATEDEAVDLTPWESFLHGLVRNASLTRVDLRSSTITPGGVMMLGAALSARATAIQELVVDANNRSVGVMGAEAPALFPAPLQRSPAEGRRLRWGMCPAAHGHTYVMRSLTSDPHPTPPFSGRPGSGPATLLAGSRASHVQLRQSDLDDADLTAL